MSNVVNFPLNDKGKEDESCDYLLDDSDNSDWLFSDSSYDDPHDEMIHQSPRMINVRIISPEPHPAAKAAGFIWSVIIGVATVLFIYTMILSM